MHFHSKKKKDKKKSEAKKKQKNRQKNRQKKRQKKKNKKKHAKIRLCLISYSIDFFVVGFISEGLSEIFMRYELRESFMRRFVPWIMTDMYLI